MRCSGNLLFTRAHNSEMVCPEFKIIFMSIRLPRTSDAISLPFLRFKDLKNIVQSSPKTVCSWEYYSFLHYLQPTSISPVSSTKLCVHECTTYFFTIFCQLPVWFPNIPWNNFRHAITVFDFLTEGTS